MPSERDTEETQTEFDCEFDAWLQEMESRIEATRESERITAEDLSIIVR